MTATTSELDFPFSAENLQDGVFLPKLNAIREAEAVFFSDIQRGWFLTRHEDVTAAFNDPRWSSVRLSVTQYDAIPLDQHDALIPNLKKYVSEWSINIDGPKHERIRKLVIKVFNRKLVESLRPMIEEACDELVSNAIAKGELDFVEDVAFPLPAMVILALLGLPKQHVAAMRRWAKALTTALASHSPGKDILLEAEATIVEMNEIFAQEVAKRKGNPGKDLMSVLVTASEDGDSLSAEELYGLAQLMVIAGHDTTANSIGMGLIALLRHPDQLQRYLKGEVDFVTAMSELLRYISMSSCQPRIAKEDMVWGGKDIKAGSVGYLLIAAGNRDPRVFDNPEALDFGRANIDKSLTFGPGLHHCLGHYLARVEMDILYRKLFARAPKIELLPCYYTFSPNFVFRTIEHIPVRIPA
ncbi:MAG TPA: cytochrome P450 [Macromonas sp.]|nr:cytochrome P450 [Macromonas sp.]